MTHNPSVLFYFIFGESMPLYISGKRAAAKLSIYFFKCPFLKIIVLCKYVS